MSWFFFAISAYFIAAVVAILDKIILRVAIPRPIIYAAWVGIFGIFALLLMPFGFHLELLVQSPWLIVLSLASGAIYVVGLYFLYTAISGSEISRINPLSGALVIIFTLLFSCLFFIEKLDNIQLFAFFLLFLGGILLSIRLFDLKSLSRKSVLFSATGAFCFAISFVLIKFVYLQTNFLNGFIVGRMGGVIIGIILLFLSLGKSRQSMKEYMQSASTKAVGLFLVNKSLAGASFLLLNYAIFLGSVALVQALSGVQYVFVLGLAVFLAFRYPSIITERISWKTLIIKLTAFFLIGAGLLVLAFREKPIDLAPGLKDFGITFSKQAALSFGLDWQKTYSAMLDDLGVKKLRLAAYWTEIEKVPGQYSFDELDWQIAEAGKRGAEIILAVGQRLPRWPECHIPDWAKDLSASERQKNLLKVIELIINRYKSSSPIKYWQVENEPFLSRFGICPPFDKKFLDKEIELVRSLDSRPIIVSDSGELSIWIPAAKRSDIFGTTMYRIVWNKNIPGGYLKYPLPPSFFHLKANLVKLLSKTKDIIVVELQAEPWGPKQIYEMPPEERDASLSLDKFKENIEYAREVGFREAYLWGAEWWYWEKLNNRPEFWEQAKALFSDKN